MPTDTTLTDDDDLLTPAQASRMTGLSESRLARLRSTGGGPPYVKYASGQQGRVFYVRRDVRRWRAAHVVTSSSDVAARVADFSGAPRVIA